MITSSNPLDPSDVLAEISEDSAADVARKAALARKAQPEWARNAAARSAALTRAAADIEQHATELADLVVREVGKPIVEAEGEVARTAAVLRYHAQAALAATGDVYPPADGIGMLLSRRSPRGTVGLITPFNFPLAIPAWKAGPALALGNAVLLKPSPLALACAIRLVELIAARLPDDVLQLCPGDGETGQALLSEVDALSFTGSTTAGRAVAAAAARASLPVQTENGGHNSAIVLPDVDVDAVAAVVARDVVGYAGQKCTSTRRVVVCGDAGQFSEALADALASLTVGDPSRRNVVAGPVITAAAAASLNANVEACRAPGVAVRRAAAPDGPAFVAPTVVADDDGVSLPAREEMFGPIVVVQSVPDVDRAVAVANAGSARLVAAVHTRDLDRALAIADQLRSGMVRVNAPTTGVDLHAPFGGEGDSGYGPREQGRAADALFSVERTVTVRPAS
ncbi:MAG TPA: aldehyde dehydrogenase family protein [Mycobacteriales bacterium]|nr:aldehyde dehydrogenase family protein [Mycobacteriales bacterium]